MKTPVWVIKNGHPELREVEMSGAETLARESLPRKRTYRVLFWCCAFAFSLGFFMGAIGMWLLSWH